MNGFRISLGIALLACVGLSQAQMLTIRTPVQKPEVANASLFFESVVQGHLVDMCKRLDPAHAERLDAAQRKWLQDRAPLLQNGRAYSLEVFKEKGTTEEKESAALQDGIRERFEPQFVADPGGKCGTLLQTVEKGPLAPKPPAIAAIAAATADPRLNLKIYVSSVMLDEAVASCSRLRPALASQLAVAQQAWQREQEPAIKRGLAYALEHQKQYGATQQAQKAWFHDQYVRDTEPQLTKDPDKRCAATLLSIETGLPVPVRGASLTDRNLRGDIFQQAQIASSCLEPDSIDASIIDRTMDQGLRERWVVNGCGKSVPMTVSYAPAPSGGTSFVVSLEKADIPAPAQK